MPIPHVEMIFCDSCGKLIKKEKFGDVMTPTDMKKLKKVNEKNLCMKCKLKNTFTRNE